MMPNDAALRALWFAVLGVFAKAMLIMVGAFVAVAIVAAIFSRGDDQG